MQNLIQLLIPTMLSSAALIVIAAASGQTPVPVPVLDLKAFTGTWYEVARLPNKQEKNCRTSLIDLIALGDKPGQLQLVQSCTIKMGYTDVHNQSGKQAGIRKGVQTADGKLKITTIFPLTTKLWVLSLDDRSALIGSPNHKKLWILSRSPSLDDGALASQTSKAASEGYATGKLISTNVK